MSKKTGAGHALVCLLLLGAMPLLAAARPADVPALTFTVILTLWQIASAVPLMLVEWRSGAVPGLSPAGLSWKEWGVAMLTGAMFGLSTWLYILAAGKVGPVNFIILLQSYPLIASLMEFVILGQRRGRAELALTVVMILAITYLVSGGTFSLASVSHWSLLVLCIPVLWSSAHMMLRRLLVKARMSANQVTLSRLLISLVFLAAALLLSGEGGQFVRQFTELNVQLPAAVFGIVYYLELLFWFLAMRHINVSLASSITVPAPALTMAASVVLLGQPVAAYQILAMLLIAASLYGLLYVEIRRGS
jgi:drug/metabolite transporter (DMT)-like permease